PGLNRFVWNLRHASNRDVKGAVFWGPGAISPKAIPGTYKVRLTVGKKEIQKDFELVKDPNLPITQEEYQQQLDLQMKIRDKLSQVHDAVNEIRGIRKQLQWYKDRTKKQPYFEKIDKAAKVIEEKLKPVEDELIQHKAKARQDLLNFPIKLNNKLAALGAWVVESSEGAPTQQALAVFADLSAQVDAHLQQLKQVIETDLAAFNRLIRELEVPAVMIQHLKAAEKKED
ncbi:MAG: glycosyl hydrolase, partial [Candidatus Aminicenantes bacterium]|nr:glycosyl hydrolase [Candidatus Aminicenantes bacterium]NIM82543.1 glycosyl hydrolase [Candidatus Aminicenantes bacterium]NIN21903.1 glycosyl hydrolase [Candidatus Aminicenantes bacterium]NIN45681.1 glycosyl hydrolase [Candidatus Aminicenantes bacterium]NIN88516.1 glycosyl hydrolase [Candidatus Aminicenantes bacterium]